jgi:hypothetical protein
MNGPDPGYQPGGSLQARRIRLTGQELWNHISQTGFAYSDLDRFLAK